MVEEDRKYFEYHFNVLSWNRAMGNQPKWSLDLWDDKMEALRSKVSTLGYKFEPKGMVTEYGIEYLAYELVKN